VITASRSGEERDPSARLGIDRRQFSVGAAAAAIRQLAKDEGIGVSGLAAATIALVAYRYTRQDDLIIEPESGGLALTIDLSRPCTFRALLRRVGADHRADVTGWASAASCTLAVPPVITAPLRRSRAPITGADGTDDGHETAVFLTLADDAQGMSGRIDYRSEAFELETIARLCSHIERLLIGAAAEPERDLATLPMLDDSEYRTIVVEWNDTARPYDTVCIQQAFEAQVARTPAARALLCAGETLTFDDLNRRSNQLARVLRAHGVGPEVLVGVCLVAPVDAVVTLLAVLKAGAAYVPLNPEHPRERLAQVIADSRLALIITTEALRHVCSIEDLSVLCLERLAAATARADGANLACEVTPDHAAYVIYTSGSTGQPKGVLGVHRSVTRAVAAATPFRDGEVCCLNASLSFGSAVLGVFLPLLRGCPTVIVPEEQTRELQQLVGVWESTGVTRIVLVAPQLRQLLALGPEATSRLQHVSTVALSGAAATPDLVAAFFAAFPHARLINAYGSIEMGTMATRLEMTRESPSHGMSVGRAVSNMRVYVLDPNVNPVPIGVPGEIVVGSADLTRGYLNRPGLTAERFLPDRFGTAAGGRVYRTGDLGRFAADGQLEFLGRTDYQVKIRGVRIEPAEIQAALEAHPDVSEAVVVAHAVDGEQRLVAYIVNRQGAAPRSSELRRFISSRVPSYMVPALFVTLERLPLTARGKVDRAALPAPSGTRPELDTPYASPRSEIEGELAGIWSRLLRLDVVGIDDHFLELGGDSLIAARLVSEIERRFGIDLPVTTLLLRPTVALLAEEIRQVCSHENLRTSLHTAESPTA
jgi:amino acid adenylation domain-containing protein